MLVQACIQDIQKQQQGIDILNEHWVASKIMELMPMVMGEVEVPMVDMKTGEQYQARKFMPEVATRLLELRSPKNQKVEVKVTEFDGASRLESLAGRLMGLMGTRDNIIDVTPEVQP